MLENNTKRNLNALYFSYIPLIIAAKIIRWTVMLRQLISVSIGWGMVMTMNKQDIPFHFTLFSLSDTHSVATDNTMAFFQSLNILSLDTFVGWEIFITVIYNIFVFLIIKEYYKTNPDAGWKENLFIYLGIGTLNIFCFAMAKEPYQMLFFFLIAFAIKKVKGFNKKTVAVTITLLFTILLSRKYFGLVLMYFYVIVFVVNRLFKEVDLSTKKGKFKFYRNLLYTVVIFAIFHFTFMSYMASTGEEAYNDLITMNYRDQNRLSKATSEIVPLFNPNNPLLVTADYILKIFRLSLPIELLFIGKYTYVLTITFQILTFYFVIRAFKKKQNEEEEEEEEEEMEDTNDDMNLALSVIEKEQEEDVEDEIEVDESVIQEKIDTRTIALYLYLAYLLCSASFEPDFGSWTRHQAVVFPILLLLL